MQPPAPEPWAWASSASAPWAGGTARTILRHRDEYLRAYGIDLHIARVCDMRPEREAELGLAPGTLTSDWTELVADPAVDIVVELIGGEHPATEIFEAAFEAGQACRDRQQGAPRPPRRAARPPRRGARRPAQMRGRGGGRHSHRERAGARPHRQRDPHRRRHPERHHQLHAQPHGDRGARLRRGPGRRAAPGLRRGGPLGRRRRLRRRKQGGHPLVDRLPHARDHRRRLHAGHPQRIGRRHRAGARARLPRGSSSALPATPRRASTCAYTPR